MKSALDQTGILLVKEFFWSTRVSQWFWSGCCHYWRSIIWRFKTYYPHPFDYPVYRYDGSSSYENAQELADKIKHADVLLAIGGGRVADTAKITAERMEAELIVIPTLVSNCAPFTPVIVAYYPDHTICKIDYAKKGLIWRSSILDSC